MTDTTLYQVEDGWLELYDGTPFHFGDEPANLVGSIDPLWVAKALSRTCRYGGHTRRTYSVLEHTLIMAQWVERQPWATARDVLTALHHDDAEAIIGDLPRPVKDKVPQFKALESHLDRAFALRFDLPNPFPLWLKDIDGRILKDERGAVMGPSRNVWGTDDLIPLGVRFKPMYSWLPVFGVSQWMHMHTRYTALHEDQVQELTDV